MMYAVNTALLHMSEQEEAALTVEDAKALLMALTVTCVKHGRAMLLCYIDWPSPKQMRVVPWRALQAVPDIEPVSPIAREDYGCLECSEEQARATVYRSLQGAPDRVPIDESLLEPLTDIPSAYRRHEQRCEQVLLHALAEVPKPVIATA